MRNDILLFEKNLTTNVFKAKFKKVADEIEKLPNDQIYGVDIDDLAKYYADRSFIEELVIFKDNIEKELSETKIKVYNRSYRGGMYRNYESEYYFIDGYKVTFTIPFDGDRELLDLTPSSCIFKHFPVDKVIAPTESAYGKIIFSLDFRKEELQEKPNSNEFVLQKFNQEIEAYYSMIDSINQEVQQYNNKNLSSIKNCLEQRLQRANDYLQMRERLELPLKLNPNAPNTKPILLKKVKKTFPSKKRQDMEYEISDSDYTNIKNIISLSCISMEKCARTFTKLFEEELRDVILSNLNTHYLGTASGETFSKTGKTDIYIPFENKAAYIAECKIWHGETKFLEAIDQLCGYTTWRDTKTSLIIFNKDNKGFEALLDSINNFLQNSTQCKKIMRLDHNKWEGTFIKKDSQDTLTINISVYDLYIAK